MPETVLLPGGSSAVGLQLARDLLADGREVCIASRSATERVPRELAEDPHLHVHDLDLRDQTAIESLLSSLRERGAGVSQVVHLVGGWTGGKGIAGQSEEKYQALATSFEALRCVSRAAAADLALAEQPRLVTVSSTMLANPTPGSANYLSVKAAVETWTLAVHRELSGASANGAAAIIRTDGLAGREPSFSALARQLLSVPASMVGGRCFVHL